VKANMAQGIDDSCHKKMKTKIRVRIKATGLLSEKLSCVHCHYPFLEKTERLEDGGGGCHDTVQENFKFQFIQYPCLLHNQQ
jgi:hypothetical protein